MEYDLSEVLNKSIYRASKENRLIEGFYNSAQILEKNQDDVMCCILQSNLKEDITLQLHIKLIEAYCCGNDIPFVKADIEEKFPSLWPNQKENNSNCCFLIKYPEETDAYDEVIIACSKTTHSDPLLFD